MNPTAQTFITSLPWTLDIVWQGRSGVHVLDKDRRVTITLVDRKTQDHFSGFNVEVTSKTTGPITSKWFPFNEYLTERADNRPDYPSGSNKSCFEVVAYCGWHWYIAIPRHPEHFTQEVERWIGLWR